MHAVLHEMGEFGFANNLSSLIGKMSRPDRVNPMLGDPIVRNVLNHRTMPFSQKVGNLPGMDLDYLCTALANGLSFDLVNRPIWTIEEHTALRAALYECADASRTNYGRALIDVITIGKTDRPIRIESSSNAILDEIERINRFQADLMRRVRPGEQVDKR